jgi:hypothetical protein
LCRCGTIASSATGAVAGIVSTEALEDEHGEQDHNDARGGAHDLPGMPLPERLARRELDHGRRGKARLSQHGVPKAPALVIPQRPEVFGRQSTQTRELGPALLAAGKVIFDRSSVFRAKIAPKVSAEQF